MAQQVTSAQFTQEIVNTLHEWVEYISTAEPNSKATLQTVQIVNPTEIRLDFYVKNMDDANAVPQLFSVEINVKEI